MVEIQNTIKTPKTFPEIWQPIASAPRDGTFVLTKSGPWQPCITHFATYDGRTRWGYSPEGFMTEEEFLRYWHEVSYEPTEWMPLPDEDVADAIETAYRNGFEDGERHHRVRQGVVGRYRKHDGGSGMTEAVFRERLQAIIDWADLAMKNREEFDSHGVRNLDGPVFDAAREALAKYPSPQTKMTGSDLLKDAYLEGWHDASSADVHERNREHAEAGWDFSDAKRSSLEPATNAKTLEEIKYLALTAGAPNYTPTPDALRRIMWLCRQAGVTKTLDELGGYAQGSAPSPPPRAMGSK